MDGYQTKYFLRKDCYSLIVTRNDSHVLMCLVNERFILKALPNTAASSQSEQMAKPSILTSEKVEEHSESMFNLTCSGASLSKDKDLMAVGDFTGKVKIFLKDSGKQVAETQVLDSVRYLHFHDYHNNVLLIATISGAVFVWNNAGVAGSTSQPTLLINLNRTVTNIRTSHG